VSIGFRWSRGGAKFSLIVLAEQPALFASASAGAASEFRRASVPRTVRRDEADVFRLQQLDPLEKVRWISLRHRRLVIRCGTAFLVAVNERHHAHQLPALRSQGLEFLLGNLFVHRRRRLARKYRSHLILRVDRGGGFGLLGPNERRRRDPALLEYVDRNLVRISVYPIPAQGERTIKLRYSEILKPEGGLRKYAYPLSTSRFGARPVGVDRPRERGLHAQRAELHGPVDQVRRAPAVSRPSRDRAPVPGRQPASG